MANLSNDLKSYLSRSSQSSKSEESVIPLLTEEEQQSSLSWWPSAKQKQSPSWIPQMSARQRALGFALSVIIGCLCLFFAGLCIPVLILRARKFAALISLANGAFLSSLCCLFGPSAFLSSLISTPRLPATCLLFLSLGAALYSSLHLQSVILTVICLTGQVVALLWLIMASVPGGQSGLKMIFQLFKSVATQTVQRTLPI